MLDFALDGPPPARHPERTTACPQPKPGPARALTAGVLTGLIGTGTTAAARGARSRGSS
ncbi:hypothetical protein ACFV9E_17820 [Streptomyces sp. NPDC059835]|uniref:hypothetical protein n=1 Tax=Streptomyces sp. NPDC059835 TaxID=3346967 RepID=UPI00365322E7